jgi:DNA-binding MarR family transcriptional regulator
VSRGKVAAEPDVEVVRLGLHRLGRLLSNRRSWALLASSADVDLPQQTIQVLLQLHDGEPRSVAELARVARMDAAAVSRQIRVLEEHGLVERQASANHGRVVLIQPTSQGLEQAQRLYRLNQSHLADALASWTEEERQTLGTLMIRLVDDLQRTPHRHS